MNGIAVVQYHMHSRTYTILDCILPSYKTAYKLDDITLLHFSHLAD